jgi:hypothetical protein
MFCRGLPVASMVLKTLESRYKVLAESGVVFRFEMWENSLRAGRSVIYGRLCERAVVWLTMWGWQRDEIKVHVL